MAAELGRLSLADRPWRIDDLFWETWSETAIAAHGRGHGAEAARRWRLAAAVAFDDGDPRRAASLNNLALVADDPAPFLHEALAAWDVAETWVAAMAVTPRGRSSTFHMRIETRNRPALEGGGRALLRRDLDAGRAVTLANLARAAGGSEGIRLAAEARDLRRAAWGPGEAGTLWLDRLAAALAAGAPAPPVPALPWPARRPIGLTDERRLKGAIYLAALAS